MAVVLRPEAEEATARKLARDLYIEKLKCREAIARNVRLNNENAALKQRIAELEAVQCIAS